MQDATSCEKRDGGELKRNMPGVHVIMRYTLALNMTCIPVQTILRKLGSSANMDCDRLLHCSIDIVLSNAGLDSPC